MTDRSILSVPAVLAAISMIVAGLLVSYLRGPDEGLEKQPLLPTRGSVVASDELAVRVVYPVPLAGSARQISLSQNDPSR